MCGIAGIVASDGRPVAIDELRRMTDRMVERGPDDEGFALVGSIGIGMRRLSIVDPAGGHQPISNEADDLHLVLNGEIYNHVELRQQLIAKGHTFRTHSDAEVVLHLYEDVGRAAVEALNGMFAFALLDTRHQALWIARDRLGVKPLFWAQAGRQFAFASDIRALRGVFETTVVASSVLSYLALGYAPQSETVWRGVRRLAPGSEMWIENGHATVQRYWSLNGIGEWSGTADDAALHLDALLSDSVRLQLRSDVPLGVFLSGGLDSSAIVALAAEHVRESLRTYTVRFEGKAEAEDVTFARVVAKRYATTHAEFTLSPDGAFDALAELLPRVDEPLADSAILPCYCLSRAARRDGIKVLLTGAGGDEIFGGYGRHHPSPVGTPRWLADVLPSWLGRGLARTLAPLDPNRAARLAHPAYAWGATVTGINLAAMHDLLRSSEQRGALLQAMRTEYAGVGRVSAPRSYTYERMRLDLGTYLPGNVLALTDKATMAASVEGRVPLLDHRLVEFAFALPERVNLIGRAAKGLFKQVMASRLPPELLSRRKEGFNAPVANWLETARGFDLQGELLEQPTAVLEELVDARRLEQWVRTPECRRTAATTLYALYLFNRWHRASGDR